MREGRKEGRKGERHGREEKREIESREGGEGGSIYRVPLAHMNFSTILIWSILVCHLEHHALLVISSNGNSQSRCTLTINNVHVQSL